MMFRRKFGLMPGLVEACTPYAAERHWDPLGPKPTQVGVPSRVADVPTRRAPAPAAS